MHTTHSRFVRYFFALTIALVAVGLRRALDPLLEVHFPFATLFLGVLVSAWLGGYGPALVALLVGALASAYLLVPPRGTFLGKPWEQQCGLLLYLGIGYGVALLGGAMRAARLRAEAAAAEAHLGRERLRVTLRSIGDGVITTDSAGRVASLNPVAEELTGWPEARARGQPLETVFCIVNEQSRQPVENPALRALAEGRIVGLANHTILIARDGREHPIDDSAAPITGARGAAGAVLVFRDITERKRASAALARLAAIVESSDDAIVSKSLDGVIQTWNAAAERLFGYTAAEAIGKPITLIIPPERQDEERAILDRLRRGERIEHFETVRVTRDGRRLHISLTVSPIRDHEGHVIGASKIARDITERHLAERERARLADSLQLALDAGDLGTWSWEPSTDRMDVSERTAAIYGVPAAGPHTHAGLCQLIHPAHREPARQAAARAAAERGDYAVEYQLARPGPAVWVAVRGRGVYDEAGRLVRFLGVAQDVTERHRAEEELRRQARELAEADARKDDFIALLAHELRNPLAPLRTGLQVLRVAGAEADAAQARDMMDRQLTHLVRMVEDLLDISRIGRAKMELRRDRITLAEAVSNAVETARPLLDAAGHRLTVTLPPEPVYLDADLTRLAQVFSNLLTNSAKYTRPGGQVWLTADQQGSVVEVTVRDTGVGIPPESLGGIFDMFAQVTRAGEEAAGGLGIGLAIVRGLVEMHGGTVTAASPGVGHGSTFAVRLPTRPAPPSAPRLQQAPAAARTRRILVVDDNADGGDSLALLLRLLGHEVSRARDGLEAVAEAEQFRPELILMDVGMPRLNGLDATRQIRAQPWGRDTTIVALTGWSQPEDRERSRQAGCDGHLVKPVGLPELQTLLASLRN